MLHAAYVCHGSVACRTGANLVADSRILSSRDTSPTLYRGCASDSLTVPLLLYINVQGGLLNASASLHAVCQELECLLSAWWGLRRQPVGRGIWVSVLPLFSTFFFFFFFFLLLLSLITSSCAGSCSRNTRNFWGFDRADSGKGQNPELGNVYLRKIWLTKLLRYSTSLFYTARNSVIDLAPYFCTRSRARWIVQPQQRAKGFAVCSCFASISAMWPAREIPANWELIPLPLQSVTSVPFFHIKKPQGFSCSYKMSSSFQEKLNNRRTPKRSGYLSRALIINSQNWASLFTKMGKSQQWGRTSLFQGTFPHNWSLCSKTHGTNFHLQRDHFYSA